ncbi:glycosyltransferase [Umezawaea tangerina]|uniref:Glycosyltransferase involved in cell wall biosynthesis n=1 Tax=Umezawaea tangerina TaxID=84725 RepID=A0A2T0T1G9_9PSEU|nr:glycosyltransferase [Umezawaea tangerina]PRY39497.1 glycosyltransferase involved in cell wall biosynthesis [Umezawaea tangerina]
MTDLLFAVLLAALAACCFAAAIHLQHRTVRDEGRVRVGRLLRTPTWLAGTSLAVVGGGLHVLALATAPLAVVQPIGVLSLVLTTLVGGHSRRAALAVCVGTAGFVVLAATSVAPASSTVDSSRVQLVVAIAAVVAVAGLRTGGRVRCLVLASAAAVLFGLGSALIRGAVLNGSPLLVGEAGALMLTGGWLVHQAYASGPPAVVIAAVTVLDPFTAVAVGIGLYGETGGIALPQLACAAPAIGGVVALTRSTPVDSPSWTRPEPAAGQRILIAADTYPPDVNGAANFANRLAEGLAARGHEVHVVCPSPTSQDSSTVVGGVAVHRIASTRTPFHAAFRVCTPWQVGRALPSLLATVRPDVVHVQAHFGVGRTVLRAALAHDLPVVATNHFMPENLLDHSPLPRVLNGIVSDWTWRDLVRVYRRAHAVTAPTPRAADLLRDRDLPTRAISCGIDLDRFGSAGAHMSTTTTAVFVGRLDPEKNVDELLRALVLAPAVHAEVVGDGVCRTDLESLALDLGIARRVRFHGYLPDDDLVAVLRRGDVFCMPGTAELQSIATMEAMAAGLPVVAANAMALPHLVHHGTNGRLYPPGDPAALAAALRELDADPVSRVAMGTASRRIVARHDLADTLDAFEDLYLRVQEEATGHDHTTTAPARPRRADRERTATAG